MKQALAARVDQQEKRHRRTLDALGDVDAGRMIDHQAIQAWADSLGTDKSPALAGQVRTVEQV